MTEKTLAARAAELLELADRGGYFPGQELADIAPNLARAVVEMAAERDHWHEKWVDLELHRASCCDQNEQRADKAEARVRELEEALRAVRLRVDSASCIDADAAALHEDVDRIARRALKGEK